MKATGIVRRMDDLGRLVIPREIRRTLRIREGDPLEIFTANDGEVILKKYSPLGELTPFATDYAEALAKGTALPVIITDREQCIAVSGLPKKEILNRRITQSLEDILTARQFTTFKKDDAKSLTPLEGVEGTACIVAPIISSGDITGAVVFLQGTSGNFSESDAKLAQVAAAFLGNQTDE